MSKHPCRAADGTFRHTWSVVHDQEGDPYAVMGTKEIVEIRCSVCDEEHHEPEMFGALDEVDRDEYDPVEDYGKYR